MRTELNSVFICNVFTWPHCVSPVVFTHANNKGKERYFLNDLKSTTLWKCLRLQIMSREVAPTCAAGMVVCWDCLFLTSQPQEPSGIIPMEQSHFH